MEQLLAAFAREQTADRVRETVESSGLASCLVCRTGAEVRRLVHERSVAAVICGCRLRDETAETLCADLPPECAILVVDKECDLSLLENRRLVRLAAPVTRSALLQAVRELLAGRDKLHRDRTEEEKDLIRRAKALLMARDCLSEDEAHRYLQRRSMETGEKISRSAQRVLDGST